MKKYAFILSSLVATMLIVYACQKDHSATSTVQNAVNNTPENAVSDRTDYADCEECLNDCYYCCVTLDPGTFAMTNGGSVTYVFNKPGLGTPRVITFTYAAPGPLTVCADIGTFYILNRKPSGSATATSCNTSSVLTCAAGATQLSALDPYCSF